ncbi:MAG: DUF1080 domain-containing protein [Chitinophagia bacterium]|jgi:archaellum component FlaF (FlaF/FlaG flagellin family)
MKKSIWAFMALCIFSIHANAQKTKQETVKVTPESLESWVPVPIISAGATNADAPSDAIVLFNGKDLSAFQKLDGSPAKWKLDPDGALTDVKGAGDLYTKKAFGNCQLHVEFRTPSIVKNSGQARGNSGVYLMGKYEVQVLDSYDNVTYSNGQAAAVYKQYAPLVNASRKPGEWQTYDIIFTAPVFNDNGELSSPGRVTVLHNGVLVQNNVSILGPTDYSAIPVYKKHDSKLPLYFQDHGDDGNPISYRNIWIREL